MGREKDLTGQRFGRLVVLRKADRYVFPSGESCNVWLCKCDCGNEKKVRISALTSGNTQSCGCLQTESRFTHNLTHHKLYMVYQSMKDRCYRANNKQFNNYGGRGIKVCDEWLEDFMNFYNWAMANGYREGLTIDRIEVNGNYEPSNCRWITHKEQQFNKRNNKRFYHDGKNLTLPEWSEILHISLDTLVSRIYTRNWDIERALTEPVHTQSRNKRAKYGNVTDRDKT